MSQKDTGQGRHEPVFYASTRHRWKVFLGICLVFLIVGTALAISATTSLLRESDLPPPPKIDITQTPPATKNKSTTTLSLPPPTQRNLACCGQIRGGFYVNWDKQSLMTLQKHGDQVNVVFPEWMFLTPVPGGLKIEVDAQALSIMRANGSLVVPMLSNAHEEGWPTDSMLAMIRQPELRRAFLDSLIGVMSEHNLDGINLDFENLPPGAEHEVLSFQRDLYHELHKRGLILTRDISADLDSYDLTAVAASSDYVVLMAYDEHYSESKPGPIASPDFVGKVVGNLTKVIPPSKIIMGLAAYGYDWPETGAAKETSFMAAMATAKDHQAEVRFDPQSSHISYSFVDDSKTKHTVWLLDGMTNYNLMRMAASLKLAGTAIWRLGGEDPRLWTFYKTIHATTQDGVKPTTRPDLTRIQPENDAIMMGEGGIIEMLQDRTEGLTELNWDDASGLISGETYLNIPAPMVYERSGLMDKAIAITFDDGPDEIFTPKVLDILAREHVPATFFLIGSNAARHTDIVRRIYDEGHEIGNHSFSHPNFAEISSPRMSLELHSTERIIEALTGHSTLLFRPPFGGYDDDESLKSAQTLAAAGRNGLLTVTIGIDPRDWESGASVDGILQAARSRSGSMMLLHDAGGDRSVTVAALPLLIDQFRKAGYRFTTVSGLVGRERIDVMPPLLSMTDRALAKCNKLLLWLTSGGNIMISWLFVVGIVLMTLRTLVIVIMARLQVLKKSRIALAKPTSDNSLDRNTLVSVIVPAYNEMLNAVAVIRHVLESEHPNIEVIFVDDGSIDQTFARVEAAFSHHPKVRLIKKANGGKASAINIGLQHAKGEIVVCIDADTRINPSAICHLLREMRHPRIAAVAGTVSIANTLNLITRLQDVEYTTAQTLDRRAFELVNAIITVPGAIGAFRLSAITEAGGFTNDTLAEDCDLTIRLLKLGYQVAYSPDAVALTEAPENLKMFLKQRFRWSFGIMQCLWKHRSSFFSRSTPGLGCFALPHALIFQFLLPTLAPLGDIFMIIGLVFGAPIQILWYTLAFLAVDMLITTTALAFARGRLQWPRLFILLLAQRFIYRYVLYVPLGKAIIAAMRGRIVGWGHLQRQGRVAQISETSLAASLVD
ncbi:MAG: glycosyltransferase [Proteobacteria bacterium]|nr:glycosyltransferase [Pseudomonadota bacterium]